MSDVRIIELTEFQPRSFAYEDLTFEQGEHIWREFGKQVRLEFPSPKTGNYWVLNNIGWTGYLPVSPDLGILLVPKVPLTNIFRMMAYAYDMDDIRFYDDLIDAGSIEEAYEQLAVVLARRILDRAKSGLYRTYQLQQRHLPFVRGRIEIKEKLRKPWQVEMPCRYRTYTADVEDNQILAGALERILRSGICSDKSLPPVRHAYHVLQQQVTSVKSAGPWVKRRTYTRLNADYATLHALSRFFLENTGPTHQLGDRRMIPFVIDMARLFERFVAAWLSQHLPDALALVQQESVRLGSVGQVTFRIDLIVRDRSSGRTVCVIDTKYKRSTHIASEDIAQVMAYAGIEATNQAFLIYPEKVKMGLDVRTDQVQIRTLGFSLEGDLHMNGETVLQPILELLRDGHEWNRSTEERVWSPAKLFIQPSTNDPNTT